MKITFTLNGQVIEAEPGQTVIDAATDAGIPIPSICHHRSLVPEGSCRLCGVEVEGRRGEIASCTLLAAEGMVVRSETPAIKETRLQVLSLLLRDYHDAGYNPDDPETEFMYWVRRSGLPLPPTAPRYPINSDPNPFVWVDMNKCIQCTRCVRACEEVQGRFVLGLAGRGRDRQIVAGTGTTMLDARCESCGACVAHCPTGALDNKMSVGRGQPDRIVTTTCGYCGVGCRFDMHVKDGEILRVVSNPNAPVNAMELCVKGRYGYDFVHHPDRLKMPRVRRYVLEGTPRPEGRGDWVETDWETALDLVAEKLVRIKRESGADAIGLLSSAKCTNEENYLAQKFARQVIGTHNVDHCARLCHASTVAGLAMCYGSGAMSNTFDDICGEAQAILIIGSNTTEQHPVFGARIRQAVLKRGVKLVVADPRRIDITEFATLHLRQRPGTDVALINGLMHIVLKNGWQDQTFIDGRCEGFEEFKATVEAYTPESVALTTGVSVEDLTQAAELLALNKPMAVIWSMGITQHTTGVPNVLSLGNLQMLLGNMGIPGGGVNPLRGQNNVQGACDMGALPNVFPGYQNVTDAAVREKFAAAWQLEGDGSTAPLFGNAPGMTSTEMVHELHGGKLRAMYIIGEDPLLTDPDLNDVHECFAACEFTVVQEIFPSDTAAYADVLLPAASFIEKDGTFTNTERRIQRVHAAFNPVGQALPDWQSFSAVAKRMLRIEGRRAAGPHAGWEYASPAAILDEIAALTPSYSGVSFKRLDRGEQLQWPVKGPDHPGTPILHIGEFTRGKGKFHAVDHLPPQELPDADYPILLTTGRVLYHWHGGEMTRRAKGLLEIYPESLVEIHPDDALKFGLNGSRRVTVTSRRGQMTAEVLLTDRVSPGIIFANFHFPGDQNINNVTIFALDPVAKIPEYKVCAVKIAPADGRTTGLRSTTQRVTATVLGLGLIIAPVLSGAQERVVAPGAAVEKLAGDFAFTEGPTCDAQGNLFFTDQPNDRIMKWSVDGKLSTFLQPAGRANGMYFDASGQLVAAADEKTALWSIAPDGKVTVIVDAHGGRPLNGPNDVWVRPDGAIYFTDPFYKRPWWTHDTMPQDGQHVYFLPADRRQLVRVTADLEKPNGIVGTPDGKTLYVADIGAGKTFRFDIATDGRLTGKTLVVEQGSDGMTLDSEGNLYLTGKGVLVFDKTGRQIEEIQIPDEEWTANVSFCGQDRRTLFITASKGLYRIRMRVRGANAAK